MARDFTNSTVSETLTDRASHPVKDFLSECGLNVDQFPTLYFTLEIQEKLLSNTQVYLPLRIPGRSGFVYESSVRVIRMMEIPGVEEQSHRSFIDVEWKVDENPLFEAESHAAFSFVSGEVECPSCRSVFIPEASIIDDRSIKINCPSCMHYWTIRVDSPALSKPECILLTDSFYQNPANLRKEISSWKSLSNTVGSTKFKNYFPFEFEPWDKAAALEWLFNDLKGYKKLVGSDGSNFEVVVKSFFNFLALKYFKNHGDKRLGQNLETTDICRKSMLIEKQEVSSKKAVQDFLVSSESSEGFSSNETGYKEGSDFVPVEEFPLEKISHNESDLSRAERIFHEQSRPITEVRSLSDFPISAPKKYQRATQSGARPLLPKVFTAVALSFFVVLFFAGAGFGYFYFKQNIASSVALNSSLENVASSRPEIPASTQQKGSLEKVAQIDNEFKSAVEETVPSAPAVVEDQAPVVSQKTIPAEKPKQEVKKVAKVEVADSKIKAKPKAKPASVAVTPSVEKTAAEPKKEVPSESIAKRAFKEAFFRQGIVYMNLQEYVPAIKEFQKVIEIDSEHILSYAYLGKAFLLEKNYEEALQSFESYLRLNPKQSPERDDILEAVAHLKEKVRLSSSR